MEAANICEKELRQYYENHYAEIYPLPFCEDTLKLDDIYTSLTLEMESGKQHFEREELFAENNDSKNPTRILVEGDPGYGKSTFCKKLAYDWSRGKCDFLKQFKLLFCIELKSVESSLWDSLVDTIGLLPTDTKVNRDNLLQYIQGNEEKVCFLFDGWDEKSERVQSEIYEIIQDRMLRNCKVVVTSRKIRDNVQTTQNVPKTKRNMHFNRTLAINGFTESALIQYVKRHFRCIDKHHKANELLDGIDKSSNKEELLSLLTCPLNAFLVCITFMSTDSDITSKITTLYDQITKLIINRYCEKYDKNDQKSRDNIDRQFMFLGELSARALIENVAKFDDNDLKLKDNEDIEKMGFLSRYARVKFSTEPAGYIINHKSFQEFLAAKYIASLCHTNLDEFKFKIKKVYWMADWERGPVLRFIAGLLNEDTSILFDYLKDARFGDLLPCLVETGYTEVLVKSFINALCKDSVYIFLSALSPQEINISQQVFARQEFMPEKITIFMKDLSNMHKLEIYMPLLRDLAVKTTSKIQLWFNFTSNVMDSAISKTKQSPPLKSEHYCKGHESAVEPVNSDNKDCDVEGMKSFTSEDFKSILSRIQQAGIERVLKGIDITCTSVTFDEFPRILDCLDSNDWLESLTLRSPSQSSDDEISSALNNRLKTYSEVWKIRRSEDQWQFTELTLSVGYLEDTIEYKSYSPLQSRDSAMLYNISVEAYNKPNLINDVSECLQSYGEKISKITLSNCQLTQNDYVKLCTKMSNCSKLRSLGLNGPMGEEELNVDDFLNLVESVTKLPSLNDLSLGDWRFPDHSGRWKDAWVKFFSDVRVLFFSLDNCLPSNRPTSSRLTHPLIDGLCQTISMSRSNPSDSDISGKSVSHTDGLRKSGDELSVPGTNDPGNADTDGQKKRFLRCLYRLVHLSRNKLTVGDVLKLQKAGLLDDNSKHTVTLDSCTVNEESANILKHHKCHTTLKIEN
ncbi:uncharacterized protein LOC144447399 [Glandiceps talaboti]